MEHAKPFRMRRFLYYEVFKEAGLDVNWDPTPRDVVDEMIATAQVRGTDLVYDLGCGDGRIVIATAVKTGARGVGVDLDPRRIGESNENALLAGVNGLTRFLKENLFEADVSDATVLFLYLFPDVNVRLRPKLLRELKPGTRIVSYSHDMGRWQPDDIVRRTDKLLRFVLRQDFRYVLPVRDPIVRIEVVQGSSMVSSTSRAASWFNVIAPPLPSPPCRASL